MRNGKGVVGSCPLHGHAKQECRALRTLCVWAQIKTGSTGSLYFGLPVTSILNSVVTLTLDAASLTLVQNVASGKVVSAQASLYSTPYIHLQL